MSSQRPAAPTAASLGKEDWFGEEPSDSTKKTLVPALARALEGSPGDVTLELVIRWACPGGAARRLAHIFRSCSPHKLRRNAMTTPPPDPAWQRPEWGELRLRWPPLVLSHPRRRQGCQQRLCGALRLHLLPGSGATVASPATAAPFASPQLFRDSAVPGAAEPPPPQPAACSPSQPALKPAALPPGFGGCVPAPSKLSCVPRSLLCPFRLLCL
ncbi:hypothetical protein PAPYR_11372 [Paratrimastix pyriformis]|uniref:Uncharacterized protein n=1 Tax=Paratrimastix pyriformis TaxID=342808 RepID=A0ABQ8U3Z6_9EUKA|nr:hypothetical protein PAPYR_11372 [Paratrimastix pyriformis]